MHDAPPSFDVLFRKYFDAVWRVSRTLVGPAMADDVTQEAFLLARRKLDTFRGGSLRGWLYGITRNVARNALRGHGRRERRHRAAMQAVPDHATASWAEAQEAADLMDRFLARLPVVQREAFFLKVIEEFTASEISEAVGVPVQTVYSRVRAANAELERFREELRADARAQQEGES